MLTDPVADMLTRIRNANKALHESTSRDAELQAEGADRSDPHRGGLRARLPDRESARTCPYKVLVVDLKYGRGRERVLTGLKRISKPGRRIYAGKDRLPRVLGGMGNCNPSTSPRRDHEPHRRAREASAAK